MRNVKITYIPENTAVETEDILVDVVRVQENIRMGQLIVEIDDSFRHNSTDTLNSIINGNITKIELLAEDKTVDIAFTTYVALRPVNRIFYDNSDNHIKDDNKLRLVFLNHKAKD